jgi:hypothetical protein
MPETQSDRKTRLPWAAWLKKAILFLAVGVLFAFSYTQSPLYTSNQNQYFIHGLAKAGYGYLFQDWLANTLDPTPLFSYLIYLTYRYLHLPAFFHLYYAILLGVYLYCLVGIADEATHLRRSRPRFWSFLALIFVVHSAALRFAFSRIFGVDWTYLLEDGVADQRLLGPVFQPSVFGVLLLVSIYLFLRRKPVLAVLAACLAAAVHPTYLLSAAALTLAYMSLSYLEQRRLAQPLLLGGIALLAAAPILIYVYTGFASTPAETTAKAQDILVNFRIPFHAVVSRWFDIRAVVKLAIIIAALFLVRKQRLFLILLIPFLVASLFTILQIALKSNTLALLFPWRISTFLTPLSTAVLLAEGVRRLFERRPAWETKGANLVFGVSVALIGLVVVIGLVRMALDFQRQAVSADRPVMAYVASHNAPDQYYMIPLEMQDFRLVTGSPIYVEFKSIPYQDQDVLEWYRRIQVADLFYKKGDCGSLEKLATIGVTHVVADYRLFNLNCTEWEQVYQDPNYRVYTLR